MKKSKIVLAIIMIAVLVACNNSNESLSGSEDENINGVDTTELLNDLVEIEAKINVEIPQNEDLQKAIQLFTSFVNAFPEDDKSPDYLLKASDFAHHLNQNGKAVALLERIVKDYPSYNRLEAAMYNRADYLDFHLKDTTLAKQYYLEFIDKYPKSEFVISAQARLDQHFMSMEDLVEMWTKK